MKSVSVVLGTYNMSEHLDGLFDSIKTNGLYDQVSKIILVDNASTDDTSEVANAWIKKNDFRNIVEVIRLNPNQGRFGARLAGAKAVQTSHVLFLDTRVRTPVNFAQQMLRFLETEDTLMGTLRIDTSLSVFNLYWQRTHESIFRKTWEDEKQGHHITYDNYHEHVKGTTALLCRTDHFLQSCRPFEHSTLLSDDTALLHELTKYSPIFRHSDFYIFWEPRQKLIPFLTHIFHDRGLSFAEYRVLGKWGPLSYLFLLGPLFLLMFFTLLLLSPVLGLQILLLVFILLFCSAALFVKTPIEFFKITWLNIAVIITYGSGALFGTFKILLERMRGKCGQPV